MRKAIDLAKKEGLLLLGQHERCRAAAVATGGRAIRYLDDLDNLVGGRFDDADSLIDHEVPIAAVFRYDCNNGGR
jgi:hypothetical protein